MTYWVKIDYDRKKFVIDLERISTFICAPNGRITFWLPDSSIPIILNKNNCCEDYIKVVNYIEQLETSPLHRSWIHISYERKEFIINLSKISSFSYSNSGKVTFWLPDSSTPIIISKQSEPEDYHKIIEFITTKTGYSLP